MGIFGEFKCSKLDSGDGCTTLNTHTKNNEYFKSVNFMQCKLYFNKAIIKSQKKKKKPDTSDFDD